MSDPIPDNDYRPLPGDYILTRWPRGVPSPVWRRALVVGWPRADNPYRTGTFIMLVDGRIHYWALGLSDVSPMKGDT